MATNPSFNPIATPSSPIPGSRLHDPSSQTVDDQGLFDPDPQQDEALSDDSAVVGFPRVLDYLGTVPESSLLPQEDGPNYLQLYSIPTLQARRTMKDNSEVAKRRYECVLKGAVGLNKPYLKYLSTASRRLRYTVFKEELSSLDSLVNKLERNEARTDEDKDGTSFVVKSVYRFEAEAFRTFMRLLFNRRELAMEAFQLSGTVIPYLPVLGIDGDVTSWRFENEFEIAGVCFRLEVEDFLVRLDKEFDFQTGRIRIIEQGPRPTPASYINPERTRDAPPHISGKIESIVAPTHGNSSRIHTAQIPTSQVEIPFGPGYSISTANAPIEQASNSRRTLWGGIPDIRRTYASAQYGRPKQNTEPKRSNFGELQDTHHRDAE
ncbi:hypothetical protein B0H11DRAFT_2331556 [Mycena galericulata]|nr:hypothetical protein B0H11DRAFT_2331556 [Mycena galericulata]